MKQRRAVRTAIISELPTPYRWPVFRKLLARPELDLRIFFCSRTERDRSWNFDFRADRRVRFLPGKTLSGGGRRTVHYHLNPTIFGELSRGRFDVVVFPGYAMFAGHAGQLFCRAKRIPYVVFSETTSLDERPGAVRALKRVILPRLVGGASAWLATGRLSRDYLVSYGARAEAVFFFPNTPDVEEFQLRAARATTRRGEIRREFGAGSGPVVLFVARLIGVKRCDLLLRALGMLRREGREPACWIAGDGPERGALETLVRKERLRRVRFLGSRSTDELPGIYAAADLFVLPSDHEPWGAVVGEAMACALPVVVSDRVGSGPDLVEEGENGAIFPHGEAALLAGVLGRLLWDPEGLRRMGHRSRDRIQRFSHDRCVEGFLAAVRAADRSGKET